MEGRRLVIDRFDPVREPTERLSESIADAYRWGQGGAVFLPRAEGASPLLLARSPRCPVHGAVLPDELTPRHFSFNSHLGACPACQGIGTESFFDPDLVIDAEKTIAQGAVRPWKQANKRMKAYYAAQLEALTADTPAPLDKPWQDLPEDFRTLLLHGSGERKITMSLGSGRAVSKPFEGLLAQLDHLYATSQSEFTKKRLRMCMGRRVCRDCGGARLRPEILAVTLSTNDGRDFGIQQAK
jgi:excinuclease ABC subunit A